MFNNSKLVHKGPVLHLFVSHFFALMPLTYLQHLTLYPLIFSSMFFGWFISIYLSLFFLLGIPLWIYACFIYAHFSRNKAGNKT